jgi:F-type H+-transporting ATPase subunit gamma
MASAREMRLRIRSVKNIAQVTRALETVSASKVRKAVNAVMATRSYATKAWQVLTHIAAQPGGENLHPLLTERKAVNNALVVVLTADRGLAGAYNSNVIRFTAQHFDQYKSPVQYITVGRKGRDLLMRRGQKVIADFSDQFKNTLASPKFREVSVFRHLGVEEFLSGQADEVWLVYTDFISMSRQEPVLKKLLPLDITSGEGRVKDFEHTPSSMVYEYEPDTRELLDVIIPRFTALQIYQAVLESQASEHAARMLAMHTATDNAKELAGAYQLQYNKVRQAAITNDILDIVGGAEALAASS